ncbi:MAG: MFS transporter [Chloroflexi bacterium]|nr:MFS transporter [Chloroflexota bacterium]
MIRKRKFPKVFPGWWTVLAGSFISAWGIGFHIHGFSALFKPIASELGLNRSTTSIAASIGRLGRGIESPLAGWLADRFGPRFLVTIGIFIAGLGLVLMNYINSLWSFYIVWGVILGTGINIGLEIPLDKAITSWFVKKRGKALSVRWFFTGLAGLVLFFVAWLVSTQGWRMTCVIGGLVTWSVGLPLAWLLVRPRRPEYYGLLPDGATTEAGPDDDVSRMIARGVNYAAEVNEVEFTIRQAIRTPAYWMLIIAESVHTVGFSAILTHGVPFLTDMGIEPVKAAALVGTIILASTPSRLLGGFLADRVKTGHLRFIMGGAFILQAIGITAFLLNQTIAMIYVFLILFWIGTGIALPFPAAIRARYFGRKAFGSIAGTSMIFLTPVGVIAPIYAGWVYDNTGSYIPAFTLFAIAFVISAVLVSLASVPKSPAQITDVRKVV